MSFHVVIPARYGSSRLPAKPLLDIAGKPMVQHVYEKACASGAGQVLVATDDERIAAVVRGFGGDVCLTDAAHNSGTERLAEVARLRGWADDDIVVNVQGDEPLLPAALIHQVAEALERNPEAQVATLCQRIHHAAELFDPHAVKVVRDVRNFALYFSRAAIPWDRDAFSVSRDELPERSEHFRHIGLYAYRCGFIQQYVLWPGCDLERMESLEQLRVLWHGGRIFVAEACEPPGHGVDTAADLARVRGLISG